MLGDYGEIMGDDQYWLIASSTNFNGINQFRGQKHTLNWENSN